MLENKEQNFEDFLQVAIDSSFKVDITGRETSQCEWILFCFLDYLAKRQKA